jgi:uncharacterized protein YqeY
MKLKDLLQSDLVSAMKSNDLDSKHIIRAVMTAAKYAQVDSAGELSDDDLVRIIQKEIKLRMDAIEEAKKGHREDIIDINQREIKLLEKYLPEQLSEAEIQQILSNLLEETGITSQKELGKIMPVAIQKINGRAPNALVSKLLREILQK